MDRDEFYSNLEHYRSMQHSGILGMKWGVKNGPPYPLKEAMKSAAEQHAAKKQESYEKAKTQATIRGNLTWAINNSDNLSNEEIRRVLDRQAILSDLRKRQKEYTDTGERKVRKLINLFDETTAFTNKGITAWNNVARILEMLGFDAKYILPPPSKRPGEGKGKGKKDDDDD